MLWQHGLERPRLPRAVTFIIAAILLSAAAFIATPRDTGQARELAVPAPSVAEASPQSPAPSSGPLPESAVDASHQATSATAPQVMSPLPKWVKTTREVTLLTGSSTLPVRTVTLPEETHLQVLGQPENGRLPVYLDGTTAGAPFGAWVSPTDVAISDAPPPRPLASSRGGSRSPNPDISTPDKFISVVGEAAQDSQRDTKVPASVTIAQAILESEWGRSTLSSKAFNFFGIKARGGPGPAGVVNMNTWEVLRGSNTVVNDAFKAYHNIFESVDDHGRFLKENQRYSAAFQVPNDAREFARRIHAAGYATDPAYSTKLIRLMDKYDLYQYDLPTP